MQHLSIYNTVNLQHIPVYSNNCKYIEMAWQPCNPASPPLPMQHTYTVAADHTQHSDRCQQRSALPAVLHPGSWCCRQSCCAGISGTVLHVRRPMQTAAQRVQKMLKPPARRPTNCPTLHILALRVSHPHSNHPCKAAGPAVLFPTQTLPKGNQGPDGSLSESCS